MPESVFFDHCELQTRDDGSIYELGAGGANTTYKGFDTRLQVPVALKIIHSDGLADEGARKHFAAAAQKAIQLRHRHIASVFHFGEEGGNCFFTREFVEGESLDAVLKRAGKLPVTRALEIVAQVTKAQRAALLQQIVHGDLRPSKVMLVNDDDETVVKILDYGLAGRSFSGGTAGMDGHHVGLPDDARPAQRQGREIDVRSDIYSLGLILWEMLTGEKPDQPIPDPLPVEKFEEVPEPVVQLLSRMLKSDPAHRPQTPAELQAEIDRCLDSPAPTATIVPEPAPPPPPDATSIPSGELVIHRVDPPVEPYHADESVADREPVDEKVEITPADEPQSETPPGFVEAGAEALNPSSYVDPQPGTGWQTRRAERPRFRHVAAVALFAATLVLGSLGYEYHRRHSTSESIHPTTEPGQLTVAEPTQLATSTPRVPTPGEPGQHPASTDGTPPVSDAPETALQPRTAVPGREPTPGNTSPPAPPSPTAPSPSSTSTPESATKEMPFVNSLGQQFVPVPGTNALFCRWDTRVCDWETFVKEAGEPNTPGMNVIRLIRVKRERAADWDTDYEEDKKATWKNPGFVQTGEHPVVGVNWNDAHRFCAWLSKKESRTYRLPTDAEWSAAVGPQSYPWGEAWPPPKGAGNYWDEAAIARLPAGGWAKVPGNDGYAYTSPVGKFNENPLGLYDMGGNAWQWCEDKYRESMNDPETLRENPWLKKLKDNKGAPSRVLRGASWFDASRYYLRSSFREGEHLTLRSSDIGFRCVLVLPDASAPGLR